MIIIETKSIEADEISEQNDEQKLSGQVTIIKRKNVKKENKPRMYLKVRELLTGVTTDLSDEVIAERGN